jgi:hypothetical protein
MVLCAYPDAGVARSYNCDTITERNLPDSVFWRNEVLGMRLRDHVSAARVRRKVASTSLHLLIVEEIAMAFCQRFGISRHFERLFIREIAWSR